MSKQTISKSLHQAKKEYFSFLKKSKGKIPIEKVMQKSSIEEIISLADYGESLPIDPDPFKMSLYVSISLWLQEDDYINMKKFLDQPVKYIKF